MIRIPTAFLVLFVSVFSLHCNAKANNLASLGDECLALVNAQYHLVISNLQKNTVPPDMVETLKVNGQVKDSRQCRDMAHQKQLSTVSQANRRLEAAIRFNRSNKPLNENERKIIESDFKLISKLPSFPAQRDYIDKYRSYQGHSSSGSSTGSIKLKSGKVYRCLGERGETTYSQSPCPGQDENIREEFKSKKNSQVITSDVHCKSVDEKTSEARQSYQKAIKLYTRALSEAKELEHKALRREASEKLSDWYSARVTAYEVGCKSMPINDSLSEPSDVQTLDVVGIAATKDRTQAEASQSGSLSSAGKVLAKRAGATFSVLKDGSVLQFGNGPLYDGTKPHRAFIERLRKKRGSFNSGGPRKDPMLLDPKTGKWINVGLSPECKGRGRSLHSATVMQDGQVLIAGGICVEPQMRNVPRKDKEIKQLTIWNAKTRSWLSGPELNHSRVFHTASLLNDGAVLIIGGQIDPIFAPPTGPSMSRQVERYKDGKVTVLSPLITARSFHSSTVRKNGCVVVAGGYGEQGQVLSKVEIWCPGYGRWRSVPDLSTARFGHSATLLGDGRILVAGGKDQSGNLLDSTEIYDPKLARWQQGPRLPEALFRHDAARLSNGTVLLAGGSLNSRRGTSIPWAWTWNGVSDKWNIAGHIIPRNIYKQIGKVSIKALPDGEALIYSQDVVMRWKPDTAESDNDVPVWDNIPPAALLLQDGRALFVGRVLGDYSGQIKAYVWDPAEESWSSAGSINSKYHSYGALLQMPSGEVRYVGESAKNYLTCKSWQPIDSQWKPCGSIQAKHKITFGIELGLLDDGRMFVLPNTSEALVLGNDNKRWEYWKVKWQTQNLGYGSPIFPKADLTRIVDPSNGREFAINDAGSRIMKRSGNNVSTSMLWNPDKKYWSYILEGKPMGADVQVLPDGCAISVSKSGVFNPETGRIKSFVAPDYGIAHIGEFVVFPDGTLIMAGAPTRGSDPGAGIFRGKASCNGIVPLGDEEAFSSVMESHNQKVISRLPKTIDEIEAELEKNTVKPDKAPTRSLLDEVLLQANIHKKWVIYLLLPILGFKLLNVIGVSFVPTIPGWMIRIPVYGLLIVILLPTILSYIDSGGSRGSEHFNLYGYSERACSDNIERCIDPSTGLLWSVTGDESRIPCHMVGEWSMVKNKKMYRIKLREDGAYFMTAEMKWSAQRKGYTGYWAMQGDKMVWRHRIRMSSSMDVNQLIPDNGAKFKLIEMNGTTETEFNLIKQGESESCSKS